MEKKRLIVIMCNLQLKFSYHTQIFATYPFLSYFSRVYGNHNL